MSKKWDFKIFKLFFLCISIITGEHLISSYDTKYGFLG